MTGPDTHIDAEALAAALDAHNRWRGDDDGIEPEPNPTELGRTIDAAAGMLRTLSARVAELEAEADDLRAELDTACDVPWPKWADDTLAAVREFSGYDGFDDADTGVDLPSETRECLSELAAAADRHRARVAALEAERAAVPAGMVQIGWGVRASIDPPQVAALWTKRPAPDDIAFMESTGGISVIVEPVYMPAAPTPTGDAPALPADAGGEG